MPDGGEVVIDGQRDGDRLRISISNPKVANRSRADGNRMALDNVRQRFELAYSGNSEVRVSDNDDSATAYGLAVPAARTANNESPDRRRRAAGARARLRHLIEERDGLEVVGEAVNGSDALQQAQDLDPDVVLLDIRMPGMGGIEAAQHLDSMDEPPAVIFTTAYDEYAIEAFDARAIGYVLKPVRRERLYKALEQAARLRRAALQDMPREGTLNERRSHVCARERNQLRLIHVDDIAFFHADQKYVRVHHRDGDNLIDDSLKFLEREFGDRFVRIHRSALVAIAFIEALEKTADGQTRILLRDHDAAEPLLVSRRHLADVRRRLKGE
ncbi:MAG: response regulator [Woeseiaceae bacterium]|nr:response regulator [Woeseiaceae bacterium]